jgi:hypothetical protein
MEKKLDLRELGDNTCRCRKNSGKSLLGLKLKRERLKHMFKWIREKKWNTEN